MPNYNDLFTGQPTLQEEFKEDALCVMKNVWSR